MAVIHSEVGSFPNLKHIYNKVAYQTYTQTVIFNFSVHFANSQEAATA